MHGDSVALATRQRTGSVWGKRKDGEEWIANTERRVLPPKTFTFIRCVATYNENSVVTLFSHTDLFQIVRRGKQIQPVQNDEPMELLPDFPALLRWFQATSLMTSREAANLQQHWGQSTRARHVLEAMRALRERLRKEILSWE